MFEPPPTPLPPAVMQDAGTLGDGKPLDNTLEEAIPAEVLTTPPPPAARQLTALDGGATTRTAAPIEECTPRSASSPLETGGLVTAAGEFKGAVQTALTTIATPLPPDYAGVVLLSAIVATFSMYLAHQYSLVTDYRSIIAFSGAIMLTIIHTYRAGCAQVMGGIKYLGAAIARVGIVILTALLRTATFAVTHAHSIILLIVITSILSRGAFGLELSDEQCNPPGPDMAKPLGPEANPPGPDMAKPLGPEAIYTLGLLSAHSALASKQAPERMIAVNLTDVKPDPQGPDMAKPLGPEANPPGPDMAKPLGPEANPLGPDKATQQFINTERLTPASLTIDENPGELTSSRDEAIPPNSAKYDGNRPDEAIPIGNNLTHINILAITTPPHSRRYQDQRGAVLTCHDALSGGGVNDDIARGIPDIPTPTGIKHGGLDP